MAKKKKSVKNGPDSQPTFEEALERLERITQQLEEGELGLSDALASYEKGVKYLQQCYQLLQQAERRIEMLCGVDSQGNPTTEPFDSQEMTLQEKAQSRSSRRSRSSSKSDLEGKKGDNDELDVPRGLF